jgi:hypothetical protein
VAGSPRQKRASSQSPATVATTAIRAAVLRQCQAPRSMGVAIRST